MNAATESNQQTQTSAAPPLQIGWAKCGITPEKLPCQISGQFHARVSEGVLDPLFATALALVSGAEHVVWVSCDVVSIPDDLRDLVRANVAAAGHGPDSNKIVLHATHTHAGPEIRQPSANVDGISAMGCGIDLPTAPIKETVEFLAQRIAGCVLAAWAVRRPGKVAFGLDYTVIGRNRRWVDAEGASTMYGLHSPQAREKFRQVEGYEDHSMNLLATYTLEGQLTGIVVNLATTAQESENIFQLSADFWSEAREELAASLGDTVFVLAQCSAAGDQTSHLIHGVEAHNRMLELRRRSQRRDIGCRIAETVGRILPAIAATAESNPLLCHRTETVELPLAQITAAQAGEARRQAKELDQTYREELAKLEADPELRNQPQWYVNVTKAFRRRNWLRGTVSRYEAQQSGKQQTRPAELHVVRLGDIAFASNPFEYYLDFGMQIKVRSPFIQTFLVQLAGRGTYVPSPRSVLGGGYGSVPASNPIGPDGGQFIADRTIELLRELAGQQPDIAPTFQ